MYLDSMSRYRTESLFWETRHDKFTPVFTTKDYDHTVDGITYPSLKKIYFSYDHVPGYEHKFAMDIFESWDHWVLLAEKSFFKNIVKKWREELEIKIKSEANSNLLKQAASSYNASKHLSEGGWKQKRKAGAPSKEELEGELKVQSEVEKNLQADMERLGLKVVK